MPTFSGQPPAARRRAGPPFDPGYPAQAVANGHKLAKLKDLMISVLTLYVKY